MPYGVKKLAWKSLQTNQLLSHQAAETQLFWLEIAHPHYPGAVKSNSIQVK